MGNFSFDLVEFDNSLFAHTCLRPYLCSDAAIAACPAYVRAYLVKGRALAALGKAAKAKAAWEAGVAVAAPPESERTSSGQPKKSEERKGELQDEETA